METLNNVATAAAKVVWGAPESKEEPINGVKGNTQAGQPYDAGNMETDQARGLPTPGQEKPAQDLHSTDMKSTPSEGAAQKTAESFDPAAVGKPELRDTPNAAEHASKPVPADSAAGGQHDTSSPTDRPEENPVPEANLKEPGPKPLEVVAREHGGDAGNVGKDGKPGKDSKDGSNHKGEHAAIPDDAEDGPQKESHGEGSGEKLVKATGFAAEGGDFDAANPGAGREADRLAEEHSQASGSAGDAHTGTAPSATKHSSNTSQGTEEKKSLKDRIKAKLHKH